MIIPKVNDQALAEIPSEIPQPNQAIPSMQEEYEKDVKRDNLLQLDLDIDNNGEVYDFVGEIHPAMTTATGETPVMTKNNNITLDKLLETGEELGADAFEIIGGGTEDAVKNSLKFVRDTLREHGQTKIGSMNINELMDLWNQSMFGRIDLDDRLIEHSGQPVKEILRGLTSVFGGMGAIKLTTGASALTSAVGSEFLVFDPKDGNLATLFRSWDVPPEFMKEVAAYIDSTEAETSAGGRLMNVIEGFLLGVGIQSITKKGREQLKNIPNEAQENIKQISSSVYERFKAIKGLWGRNNSFDDYLTENKTYEKKLDIKPNEELITEVKKYSKKYKKTLSEEAELFLYNSESDGLKDVYGKYKRVNFDRIKDVNGLKRVLAKALDISDKEIEKKTFEDIIEESKKLNLTAKDMMSVDPKTWDKSAEGLKFRDIFSQAGVELIELAKRQVAGELEDGKFFEHWHKLAMLSDQLKELKAGPARTTTSFRIESDPERAGRAKFTDMAMEFGKDLPADIDENILAQRILELSAKKSPEDLANLARNTITFKQVFKEVWYNFLLSSPKTQAANILSTPTNIGLHAAERLFASGIGSFRSGSDRVAFGEALSTFYKFRETLADAWRLAGEAYRTGQPQMTRQKKVELREPIITAKNVSEAAKKIHSSEGQPIKKFLTRKMLDESGTFGRAIDYWGKKLRIPTRALTSGDEFFKTIAYRMEVNYQSYKRALKDMELEKLNEEEFQQRLREYQNEPPRDIRIEGEKTSDYLTMQQELGERGTAFKNFVDKMNWGLPWGRLTVPFVDPMLNIQKFAFERVPVVNLAFSKMRNDLLGKNGGAAQDLALGRNAMGATILGTGYLLATGGIDGVTLNGSGPMGVDQPTADKSIKGLRDNYFNYGWSPLSVQYQDNEGGIHTYQFSRLDPFATLWGTIADAAQMSHDVDDPTFSQVSLGLMAILANNIFSKNFAKTTHELLTNLVNPSERSPRYLDNLVKTTIPRIVNDMRQLSDNEYRELQSMADGMSGFLDIIKSQTVGWSKTLPPKKNIWDEPILSQGAWGPDWLSPFRYSHKKPDIVDKEVYRLQLAIKNVPNSINGIRLHPMVRNRWIELSNEKDQNKKKTMKEEISSVIKSKIYQQAESDELRSETLANIIVKRRKAAKRKLMADDGIVKEFQPDLYQRIEQKKSVKANVTHKLEESDYYLNYKQQNPFGLMR